MTQLINALNDSEKLNFIIEQKANIGFYENSNGGYWMVCTEFVECKNKSLRKAISQAIKEHKDIDLEKRSI